MTIRHAVLALSFAFLGACASNTPPAPALVPAPVAGVGAPAAPPPAAGVSDAQQQQFIKLARSRGYHVEVVNSERRYCKSQDSTSSHLLHKECLNENQMADKIKNGQDVDNRSLQNNAGVLTRQGTAAH